MTDPSSGNSSRTPVAGTSDPPVCQSELLYRRLGERWPTGDQKRPAQRDFMPRRCKPGGPIGGPDSSGLSVYLASLTTQWRVAFRADKGDLMALAELPAAAVYGNGMTVKPDGLTDPGHAVIPELNSRDRDDPERSAWIRHRAELLRAAARVIGILEIEQSSR